MRGPEGPKNREAMIRGMFTPATPAALQDHVLKMMLAAPEATAYGAMVATFDPKVWTSDVMTMPVLGLFADKSALGNPDATRKVFPTYEHHEIPGTGHFLMMEKPREFNALLTAFVDKLPESARRVDSLDPQELTAPPGYAPPRQRGERDRRRRGPRGRRRHRGRQRPGARRARAGIGRHVARDRGDASPASVRSPPRLATPASPSALEAHARYLRRGWAPSLVKVGFDGVTDLRLAQSLAEVSRARRPPRRRLRRRWCWSPTPMRPPWRCRPATLLEVASTAGAAGVLLDTADKSGPRLTELVSPAWLTDWVALAHRRSLLVCLAGRLRAEDLPIVRRCGADVAGVRGAACDGGRGGRIECRAGARSAPRLCGPSRWSRSRSPSRVRGGSGATKGGACPREPCFATAVC